MKKTFAAAAAVVACGLGGCGAMHSMMHGEGGGGWTTILDGRSMDGWDLTGNANWRVEGGSLVADKGNGFLLSKESYGDFELRAEFYVDDDSNSGIHIRCDERVKIDSNTCYEVNIFDKRPDPLYGTGAIVGVSKVNPMPKAGGKWNTYEIWAKGDHMVVKLNGVTTADGHDGKHKAGPIGLQCAPGAQKESTVVKFRKVEIRRL